MGLFDVDGFGEHKDLEPIKIKEPEKVFESNDFDRSLTEDVSPLLKMEIINKHFHLGSLLKNLGIDISNGTMYCPFHDDRATGKPSAKYHENTDLLYCFSENKMYSAYHAIKFLYNKDVNKVFQKIWLSMPEVERHEYMDKYNVQGTTVKEKTKWDELSEKVLSKFKFGQVSYRQYKNALYKVLMIVKDDKSSNNKQEDQIMEFNGLQEGIVGMRLPNGTVKVIKSSIGHIGEVFENDSKFYERFQSINESNGTSVKCSIIESING